MNFYSQSLNFGIATLISILVSNSALSFESTQILPKGIRNVTIKTVNAVITEKTDANRNAQGIAAPLEKNVKFSDILSKETRLKQSQIRSIMNREGFSDDDSLGQMHAEMQGNVTVTAPIISYGFSDKLTLAIAIPYYKAHMAIDMGFVPTDNAQKFVDALGTPLTNQVEAARTAGSKLNNAVPDLNQKLEDNGFDQLNEWEAAGIGDITLAAKYLMLNRSILKIATTSGLVLPTGRVDDPDNLIDIPFGDGTLDVFSSLITDQKVGYGITLNQYAKYTYQSPAFASKRMTVGDEKIEVEKKVVHYKLGDKLEAGTSVQFAGQNGIVSALGVTYFKKLKDRFDAPTAEIRETINHNTDQESSHVEGKFGYSSLPAFKRGSTPVPFMTTLEYKRHIASKNMPSNDLITIDMALFF